MEEAALATHAATLRRSPRVDRDELMTAVSGREPEVLANLGIAWSSKSSHISCPYPDHDDTHPSWRWDDVKRCAFCTCSQGDDIIGVVMKVRGVDFPTALVRMAEIVGRGDLVKGRETKHRGQDTVSLLAPEPDNRDDELPWKYLGHRLGIDPAAVPRPSTRVAGHRELRYYEQQGDKRIAVREAPCVAFEIVGVDGGQHAHRIYVAPDGKGKADLGAGPNGQPRDAKKLAPLKGKNTVNGYAASWGDPSKAPTLHLAEGVETAAAIAHVFIGEIERGEIAVMAAISAGGIEAFQPRPGTKRVVVCADRDEDKPEADLGYRRGERAAQVFAERNNKTVEVAIALPGEAGTGLDWLDVLNRGGASAVRAGIDAAERFTPEVANTDLGTSLSNDGSVPGLRMTTRGLFYEDKDGGLRQVAGPFQVLAETRDAHGESWGVLLTWKDHDDRSHEWAMPRKLLSGDGNDVRARLLDGGLHVAPDPAARKALSTYLTSVRSRAKARCVDHAGWHEDTYVQANAIYGAPAGERIILQSAAPPSMPSRCGTLEGWQQEVAAPAAGNSRLVLALSVAFAGPLLRFAGEESFGFHFAGSSSGGKTTALRVAASAWGGSLASWRTTDNAAEAMARAANDGFLALDELRSSRSSRRRSDGVHARQRPGQGADEARHSRATHCDVAHDLPLVGRDRPV